MQTNRLASRLGIGIRVGLAKQNAKLVVRRDLRTHLAASSNFYTHEKSDSESLGQKLSILNQTNPVQTTCEMEIN